jgi:hypothetical protein
MTINKRVGQYPGMSHNGIRDKFLSGQKGRIPDHTLPVKFLFYYGIPG